LDDFVVGCLALFDLVCAFIRISATALVLAFSLIMLNTDLHTAEVKTKMSKDQFVANFDGIDEVTTLVHNHDQCMR
jgi:Sec7-like guanine-nucleotide exchange factor